MKTTQFDQPRMPARSRPGSAHAAAGASPEHRMPGTGGGNGAGPSAKR